VRDRKKKKKERKKKNTTKRTMEKNGIQVDLKKQILTGKMFQEMSAQITHNTRTIL
jgi:hypothetical protein